MPNSKTKFKSRNPEFRKLIEEKLIGQYFMRLMDFEITSIQEGEVKGELIVNQKHHQQNGFLHGGVISTMADIVMGFSAFSLVEAKTHVVTADLNVSYFAPGIGEKAFAEGRVLKNGKKLNFCSAEIFIEKEGERKLIAHATSTMASILPEDG